MLLIFLLLFLIIIISIKKKEKFTINFFKRECFFLKKFLKNITKKIDSLLLKIIENFNKNKCSDLFYNMINKLININNKIKKLIKELINPFKNIKNIPSSVINLIINSNNLLKNIPLTIIKCKEEKYPLNIEHFSFNFKNIMIDIMIFILDIFQHMQLYLIRFSERVLSVNSFIDNQ